MSDQPDKRSMWVIAIDGVVRAPRRLQWALAFNVVVTSVVAIREVLEDYPELPSPLRLAAFALVLGGGVLLSFASVLWNMSQRQECGSFFEIKKQAWKADARRLDEALIVFPVLVFMAGWMLASGFAVFFTQVTGTFGKVFLVRSFILALVLGSTIWAVRMLASTTRFLHDHARDQAAAAERARGEAAEAQLATLQAQMNPHFLFNTLNTVASLIRTDVAAAEATVENLAVVLRRTLDRSRRILSPVDDEIDHLAAYLSVAKQRFGDRLQVHWAVDPEARNVLLPTMTIQPLVENSLKHGIGARLEGGALHIGVQLEEAPARARASSRRESSRNTDSPGGADSQYADLPRLVIEVADDGPGFPRRYTEGTGLSNLRERLATLYGQHAGIEIDRSGPGSRVVVTLPAVAAATDATVALGPEVAPVAGG